MTEEIINKDELKNLRFLLQSGQKLAISTKEFERVFNECDRLKQENEVLKKNAQVLQDYITKNEQLKTNIGSLASKNVKLKRALEEIREILNNGCGIIENAKVVGLINEVLNDD